MVGLIALSLVPQVGRVALSRVVQSLGYGRTLGEYLKGLVIEYPSRKKQVEDLDQVELTAKAKEIVSNASEDGQEMLSWHSDAYPHALKQTAAPPAMLFSVGQFVYDKDMYSVAFVTAGRPTSKGFEIVERILSLSTQSRPLRVFTGLTDTLNIYAAEECLARDDVLLSAFLPCGLDIPYPIKDTKLYHRIREKGIMYSEFYPGQTIESYRAIERDTLIVSASDAIVLVEGKYRGRVKRMVELARSLGKPVYYSPELVDYSEAVSFVDATGQGIPLERFQ